MTGVDGVSDQVRDADRDLKAIWGAIGGLDRKIKGVSLSIHQAVQEFKKTIEDDRRRAAIQTPMGDRTVTEPYSHRQNHRGQNQGVPYQKLSGVFEHDLCNFKKRVPSFNGTLGTNHVLDWIDLVDDYFDETNPPEALKYKLAATKLKGEARKWWMELQNHRLSEGKCLISSWPKLSELLYCRFSPTNCSTKLPNQREMLEGNTLDFHFLPATCLGKVPLQHVGSNQGQEELINSGLNHISPKKGDIDSVVVEVKPKSSTTTKATLKKNDEADFSARDSDMGSDGVRATKTVLPSTTIGTRQKVKGTEASNKRDECAKERTECNDSYDALTTKVVISERPYSAIQLKQREGVIAVMHLKADGLVPTTCLTKPLKQLNIHGTNAKSLSKIPIVNFDPGGNFLGKLQWFWQHVSLVHNLELKQPLMEKSQFELLKDSSTLMIKNPTTAMHCKGTGHREQKDVEEMKLQPTQLSVVSTVTKPTFTQDQVNQPNFRRIKESKLDMGDEWRLSKSRARNLKTCEGVFPRLHSDSEFLNGDILLMIFDPGGMCQNEQRPKQSKFLVCVVPNLWLIVNNNSLQFNISVKYCCLSWHSSNLDFGAISGNVRMEDHRSNEAEYDFVWLCCKGVKHSFSICMNDHKFCLIMKPKENYLMIGMITCQADPLTPKEMAMGMLILCKSYYRNGKEGILGHDLDGYSMNHQGITHVKVTNVVFGFVIVWQLERIFIMAAQTWFKELLFNLMTCSQEANQLICNVVYQKCQLALTRYCVLMNNLAMSDGLDNDKYAKEENAKLATIDIKPQASAKLLIETGDLVAIFGIQRKCFFHGYAKVTSSLVRHSNVDIGTIIRQLESFGGLITVVLRIIMVELELNFNLDRVMEEAVKTGEYNEFLWGKVKSMLFMGHWHCDFYITRGRVIPWDGWNDVINYNAEERFTVFKLKVITIFSRLRILCENGQLTEMLKLFFKLVNGLDPPKYFMVTVEESTCGNNYVLEGKFISIKLYNVTISSCLSVWYSNEQLRMSLKLFHDVVNGLDPPMDIDGVCWIFQWIGSCPGLSMLQTLVFTRLLTNQHLIKFNSRTSLFLWSGMEMMQAYELFTTLYFYFAVFYVKG